MEQPPDTTPTQSARRPVLALIAGTPSDVTRVQRWAQALTGPIRVIPDADPGQAALAVIITTRTQPRRDLVHAYQTAGVPVFTMPAHTRVQPPVEHAPTGASRSNGTTTS